MNDRFGTLATLETPEGTLRYHRLERLQEAGIGQVDTLPYVLRPILESALRACDGDLVTEDHVAALAAWRPEDQGEVEVPFSPARVLLQDFTGVPAVVDLAAMRSALHRLGGDPRRINPVVPADLVIDHSVQVDRFGTADALEVNARREFERNRERYTFLRWGSRAFENFRVVPPATGIVHQVNLEYLAQVVHLREGLAYPDTLVGTDSHTTMINGLGVVGWGVGGIEAEAALLGQPIFMLLPRVVGVRLHGRLPEGATATDLVLTVTELLRRHGVVGKLVEFHGPGLDALSLPDRATLANMSPEYGSTTAFFPVDDETLAYLRQTGRPPALVARVEAVARAQGTFRTPDAPTPRYTETLELDLGTVVPCLAGPRRPQDRVPVGDLKASFHRSCTTLYGLGDLPAPPPARERRPRRHDTYAASRVPLELGDLETEVGHGVLAIAAITSCTNTSNPTVLVAAGLLARNALARGLMVKPWVKTSLAPGSRAVTRYLDRAGLLDDLAALRFALVGYGCTTCIGNSGPIVPALARVVQEKGLVAAAVLSGNRNFEGRINPLVRANYLASPPLVVAYALAGTVDIDLLHEPLGHDPQGGPVYLADIWPDSREIREIVASAVDRELFEREYADVFDGNPTWNAIPVTGGDLYDWDPDSTYIQEPPFFQDLGPGLPPLPRLRGARVLALLGDSVTTDHISPAGAIPVDSPAGRYLRSRGVEPADFNSFGSRRGNHEVMMRGTFGNIRLRNQLAPGTEGGFTRLLPEGEVMPIYDAAMRYQERGTPLVVLAGSEYGTGSSRDWAAKGTWLLGVRAVIAKSFERIHRSNLVGMGVLPLQFREGEGWRELGLTGEETFDIDLPEALEPGGTLEVRATAADGTVRTFPVTCRVDSTVEVRYWRNGGILHAVLRDMVRG